MVYVDVDGKTVTGKGKAAEKPKELWEPCPRCGSKHVHSNGTADLSVMWLMMFLGLCFTPVCFLIGVPLLFGGPLVWLYWKITEGGCACQDCKHTWTMKS